MGGVVYVCLSLVLLTRGKGMIRVMEREGRGERDLAKKGGGLLYKMKM